MAHLSLLCLGFLLLASVWSTSLNVDGSSKRVLVLLDNLAIRETHSFYFQQLKGEHGFSSVVRVNIRCSILSIGNQMMNSINIAVHILNIFDWNDHSIWRLSLVKIRFLSTFCSSQFRVSSLSLSLRSRLRYHLSSIRWYQSANRQVWRIYLRSYSPLCTGNQRYDWRCHRRWTGVSSLAEFGGRLDAEILAQFVDAGGNVLVAGSNIIGRWRRPETEWERRWIDLKVMPCVSSLVNAVSNSLMIRMLSSIISTTMSTTMAK